MSHIVLFITALFRVIMCIYTVQIIGDRGVLKEGVNFIQKPFSEKVL